MKTVIRLLATVPLVMGLAACIEATAPRLPVDSKEDTDTARDNTGYLGEAQPPVELA